MTAIHPTEIKPGLVVTLDPTTLARDPDTRVNGSLHNARFEGWRSTPFIVLERRPTEGSWLLAHCGLNSGQGRRELRRSMKRGSQWWTAQAGYVTADAAWLVTTEALVVACDDPTRVGSRNRYASGNNDADRRELEAIAMLVWNASPAFAHPVLPMPEAQPLEEAEIGESVGEIIPSPTLAPEAIPDAPQPHVGEESRRAGRIEPHVYGNDTRDRLADLLRGAVAGDVPLPWKARDTSTLSDLVRANLAEIVALHDDGATWPDLAAFVSRAGVRTTPKSLARLVRGLATTPNTPPARDLQPGEVPQEEIA